MKMDNSRIREAAALRKKVRAVRAISCTPFSLKLYNTVQYRLLSQAKLRELLYSARTLYCKQMSDGLSAEDKNPAVSRSRALNLVRFPHFNL